MNKVDWAAPVSTDEAARRAAGRRRYNSVRQLQAQLRRIDVECLLYQFGWQHGTQARIAEALGVSESTVSRDLKAVFPGAIRCPACACTHPLERWRELERQGRVKLGCTPSDHEESPHGHDGDDDVDAHGQRHEDLAPVDPTRGQATDDDLQRFVELTNQMTEQNATRMIEVDEGGPSGGRASPPGAGRPLHG